MSGNSFLILQSSTLAFHHTSVFTGIIGRCVSSDLLLIVTKTKTFINFCVKNIYMVVGSRLFLQYNMLSRLRDAGRISKRKQNCLARWLSVKLGVSSDTKCIQYLKKKNSNNQFDAMTATCALRSGQIILSWEPDLVT